MAVRTQVLSDVTLNPSRLGRVMINPYLKSKMHQVIRKCITAGQILGWF